VFDKYLQKYGKTYKSSRDLYRFLALALTFYRAIKKLFDFGNGFKKERLV